MAVQVLNVNDGKLGKLPGVLFPSCLLVFSAATYGWDPKICFVRSFLRCNCGRIGLKSWMR